MNAAKPFKLLKYIFIIYKMKYLSILFIFSILSAQYDFSLEDLNPNSDYYGNNVGTSFFEGKITLNYFGYFT
tara:strand:+ start:400 stop:615 length:216 start_codon:yes stop_codon:yes gene_type:complete